MKTRTFVLCAILIVGLYKIADAGMRAYRISKFYQKQSRVQQIQVGKSESEVLRLENANASQRCIIRLAYPQGVTLDWR